MATTFTTRARFFTGHGIETLPVIVNLDDSIQVWDSVAGHYTRCHALAPAAQRRIRREARVFAARCVCAIPPAPVGSEPRGSRR